jgi:hypothetical protein
MKSGISLIFRLEKIYLDFIDAIGNCFIIYRVDLQFFFIKINYSSMIFSDSADNTTEKSTLKRTGKPESDDLLNYSNNHLHVSGTWNMVDKPLPLFIFMDRMNHELKWNCHHPKSLTEIVYNGRKFNGYGYAETLCLSIKPWHLPIEELRWGRFLSDEYSIIWINWKGDHPLNKLYCNGMEYNDSLFEEERIIYGRGTYILFFNQISVVRKGKLSNLFSGIKWIKIFFNRGILNTIENKYKAKSVLSHNRKILSDGWTLYEIVKWKN